MNEELSEAEMIRRCLQGDSQAWDHLFDLHYAPTARFIFQLSPDISVDDADELCQDVFLAVIRNLKSFSGNSQFRTWLFRIATNKTRDYRQKRSAAKRGGGRASVSLDAENPATGLRLDLPSGVPGPDRILEAEEQGELLHEALLHLGEPCREVIELRYFGELSYEEIATSLKLNPKTVSSRLSKCLDKLEDVARGVFSREGSRANTV